MKNKKKGFKKTLLAAITLGVLGSQAEEHNKEVSSFLNSPAQYVQVTTNLNYMDSLKKEFFSYKITKDNTQLKSLYTIITTYNYPQFEEKTLNEFISNSNALLRKIKLIQNQEYQRGSPKFNEIQQKVLPHTKDYLLKAVEIIESKNITSKELKELKNHLNEK